MATLLYRLGHFSYRRPWIVIGTWLLLLLGLLGGGFALGGSTQENFSIPGTESQDTIDHLGAVFPQAAGASVQVVYQAPDGATVDDASLESAIELMATKLESLDGVAGVVSPFSEYASDQVSPDRATAYTQLQLSGQSSDVTQAQLDAITATASTAEDAGLEVAFGGQVFQDTTFGLTITEVAGVIFAAIVLIVTFGSLLAAGMPLLSALLGVGVTMGGIIGVTAFTAVSSTAPMLAVMLGLAVGIDYSLFIVSRHRQQLAQGMEPEESAATAVATAGSAVVFAGVTVIIALLGLLVVGVPFLSVMGLGAAFAVLIAVLVALTFLPAVLGLAGKRFAPKAGSRAERRARADLDGKPTAGRRWVNTVLRAPVVAAVAVVGILGVLTIPALSLDLNLPTGAAEPAGSTQQRAYTLIEDGFGPGYNGPLVIAVDITQTTDIFTDLDKIGERLRALPGVASVSSGLPNEGVDTAIIQVVPTSAPDDPATKALVERIRELAPAIADDIGTPITVTGQTAVAIDISNRLSDALIPFGIIVVGLSVILLTMVFRSLFVPITAALGFLLSVGASIGATVAIFQWGWLSELVNVEHVGPILSFLPVLLMAVLFGLAMDYQVFLVSGMREEFVKTGRARTSVVHGYQNAARVVTAAALIMFFVFIAFVPEGSGPIKGIAFALAVGVAFDAFLVRMTLIPALMALAGPAAWWLPRWLDRILPNVDIEGEGLRHHLADRAWANGRQDAITLEGAVLGLPDSTLGPLDAAIGAGSIVFVDGGAAERRILAATLSGRLDPVSGRMQVLGAPLPSERGRALRSVALADVGTFDDHDSNRTVGEVLSERLELVVPWYRAFPGALRVDDWVQRIGRALGRPIGTTTGLAALDSHERAVVLVAAALTEKPGVVFVDLGDALAADLDADRLATVLATLAPAQTTLILGARELGASGAAPALVDGRRCLTIALSAREQSSLERDGALR